MSTERNLAFLRRKFFIKLKAFPKPELIEVGWEGSGKMEWVRPLDGKDFQSHDLCSEPCDICSPDRVAAIQKARNDMFLRDEEDEARLRGWI